MLTAVIAAMWASLPSSLSQTAPENRYPLQVLLPRPARSSPDPGAPSISANHRIFHAYPGVLYNIRGAVIGGAYPYAYALENAPADMTIDPATGEIFWPNPQSDATNITFRVIDAAGTQVSTTWSIHVNPTKFIFLNAAAPAGGNGSWARPYDRLSAIPSSVHAGKIAYFMSGTYSVLDMPRTGGDGWDRVEFNGVTKPLSWIEYPGESAVIDFGWDGSGIVPMIRMSNGLIYLDGFETARSHNMAFQFGLPHFGVVRRMSMHHQGPGQNGANSAFIMFLANYGAPAMGMIIQDNTFSDITYGTGNCALKMYSLNKSLIEDNLFQRADTGTEALVAIKSDNPRFTVRGNTFHDIGTPAIGGNMHRINDATHGEILFNHVGPGTAEAIFVNQDSQATRVDIHRNTFHGRVRVRNTDSEDGPFHFAHNVIVSNDPVGRCIPGSRIYCENVTDASRITVANNLEGSPSQNITDSTGRLTAAYASQIGTHGFQLRPAAPPTPPRLESPNFRPNGSFYFRLSDAPSTHYVIRASSNLIQWQSVATNQVLNGELEWEDLAAGEFGFRFYQVLIP